MVCVERAPITEAECSLWSGSNEAREDIDRAIELEPRDPSLRENRIATPMAPKDGATVVRDAGLRLERFPPRPEWLSAGGRVLAAEENGGLEG